jgi:DNA-binding PadR family transcriptional regulator
MDALTDLEAVVLGLLWRRGGATAYAVRQALGASPAARFSDSAGSVYPLVRRLARRGLLSGRRTRSGARRATVWECTAAGRAALRAWLAVPETPPELVTADPLRTRALYLGLLSPAARARWLERAEAGLRAHAGVLEGLLAAEGGDPWLALAHRNALLQAQARLAWLRETRAALEHL